MIQQSHSWAIYLRGKVKLLSRVRLFATPWMDGSPPGSSVHGILQARILEWVACLPPRDLPDGIEPTSPVSQALAGGFFTTEPPGKPHLEGYHYLYSGLLSPAIIEV